jgi:hypothetical protein
MNTELLQILACYQRNLKYDLVEIDVSKAYTSAFCKIKRFQSLLNLITLLNIQDKNLKTILYTLLNQNHQIYFLVKDLIYAMVCS